MGSCMSKTQSLKYDNTRLNQGGMQEERRRRLSLSQSANVKYDPGDQRGSFHFNATEDSILNLFSGRRRFSLSGAPALSNQNGFEDKSQIKEGSDINLSEFGIGFSCKKGLKPESPNQDDFFIMRVDEWGLYGVFDGHGPDGHDISNYSQRNFAKIFVNHPQFKSDPKKALTDSFVKLHEQIEEMCLKYKKFDCHLSGTTATVLFHHFERKKLYIAHVGDSRAVVCIRDNKSNTKCVAIDLTEDHKPELEKETKRILSRGGVVKKLDYDIPYRVFIKSKPLPGLAMSRALGDSIAHSVGVISVPDVSVRELFVEDDQYALICSDGVWEFISSQEAVDIIHDQLSQTGNAMHACEELAAEAWKRWITYEVNVVDDITVIYADLTNKGNPITSPRANECTESTKSS